MEIKDSHYPVFDLVISGDSRICYLLEQDYLFARFWVNKVFILIDL